jgi:hypothetical protein
VATDLRLPPLGKILVSGVGPKAHYHNAYLFHIGFVVAAAAPGQVFAPGAQIPAIVQIYQTPIYGAEIGSTGGLFDVLLGMDVISSGQLVVGNQLFSFSWRKAMLAGGLYKKSGLRISN